MKDGVDIEVLANPKHSLVQPGKSVPQRRVFAVLTFGFLQLGSSCADSARRCRCRSVRDGKLGDRGESLSAGFTRGKRTAHVAAAAIAACGRSISGLSCHLSNAKRKPPIMG